MAVALRMTGTRAIAVCCFAQGPRAALHRPCEAAPRGLRGEALGVYCKRVIYIIDV